MPEAAPPSVTDQEGANARRERLEIYRTYAVIAGLLIPFFWVVYRITDPAAADPLWVRLGLSALCFGALGLSYVSAAARERFIGLMHAVLYVLTAWFVWLTAVNGFSPNYAVGLLFVISAIAVGVSTGLRRIAPLRWYLLFAVVLTAVGVSLVPSAVGPVIFLACVASIGLVIHVAAGATIRAQAQLSLSERKYRRLFSAASDAILVVDPERLTVVDANRKAVDLYGYAPEELIGLRVDRIASDPWFDDVPGENLEAVHRRKNGEAIHVLISTAEIDYGDRIAYLSINRDVTERVHTMASLSEANTALVQRTRDLQDFTTAASHDLQEPVRKIRTFADLVREEYAERLDGTGRQYLERMQEIGAQMSRIIADLLVFSRIASGDEPHEDVDLTDLARAAADDLEPVIAAAGARVEIQPLPRAEVVPTQIRDLIRHLLANAVEARRDGTIPTVHIRGTMQGNRCRVEICDNGVGIDERHFEKIFSPFRHLKNARLQSRTGMGLAICKRIVEHHAGTLRVESTVGEGSTFTVELPRRQGGTIQPRKVTARAPSAEP